MKILTFAYLLAIAMLVLSALLGIACYSSSNSPWVVRMAMMSFINNMAQFFILVYIIFNFASKASEESPPGGAA